MHLDILFFIVHRAFLSGAFGSSTGEYSYSSCSSLPSDNFVRLLTGPMFIFEHFSSKTSPTRHSIPSKLWELKPSSNKLKPSNRDEDTADWGLCMDLLCIFECIGYWETGKSPLLCIMDGTLCIILCSLTFLIVLMFTFKCFLSTASLWRSFNPPTPWMVKPSFGCCWIGSTAIWGPYLVFLRVFTHVKCSGTSKFPSSYIRDSVLRAVSLLLVFLLVLLFASECFLSLAPVQSTAILQLGAVIGLLED